MNESKNSTFKLCVQSDNKRKDISEKKQNIILQVCAFN